MPEIHPTALVDPSAELAADATVGPFAIVEGGVRIGAGTVIEAAAQILRGVEIGENCRIGRAAIIGGEPQSLAFDLRVPSGARLGDGNRIREHVTIHRSAHEGKHTLVGDNNFIMASVHIGHDAVVGDYNVLANGVLIAGHVHIGNRTFLGGGSAYHQFIRVGDYAMTQGNGSFSKDVCPFLMAAKLNTVIGLNVVGLRRAGFDASVRMEIKAAFDLFFRDGRNLSQAVTEARERSWGEQAEALIRFVETRTEKGICTPTG